MNIREMTSMVGILIEDKKEQEFKEFVKIESIRMGQEWMARHLALPYLGELQHSVYSLAVANDTNALWKSVSFLNNRSIFGYIPLKGYKSIISISDSTTATIKPIKRIYEAVDMDKMNNSYYTGTATDPCVFLIGGKIIVQPITITKLDIVFLCMPDPPVYKYSYLENGTPDIGSPDKVSFIAKNDEGVDIINGKANDYFNDTFVHDLAKFTTFKVTDFDSASVLFTVLPAAATNFTTVTPNSKFQFIFTPGSDGEGSKDFTAMNSELVTPDLNESFHEMICRAAQAEMFRKGNDSRYLEVTNKLLNEINELNAAVGGQKFDLLKYPTYQRSQ